MTFYCQGKEKKINILIILSAIMGGHGPLKDSVMLTGYFAAGHAATSMFYGVSPVSPEDLLCNGVSSAVSAMVSRKVIKEGSILYFVRENPPGTSVTTLKEDMAEGFGTALLAGAMAGAAVRVLFFGIPMMPAAIQSLAGAAVVWGVTVQPSLNKITAE